MTDAASTTLGISGTAAANADPADVAAASSVAAALLGAAGQLPSSNARPTGALPPLPPAPTMPSNSRYVAVTTAVWVAPDGREVAYLRRRPVPPPEALATAGWTRVADGDRADLLAARALGDPTAFWRLADANLAFDVAEIEQPGATLRVALPEGFPGAPGA